MALDVLSRVQTALSKHEQQLGQVPLLLVGPSAGAALALSAVLSEFAAQNAGLGQLEGRVVALARWDNAHCLKRLAMERDEARVIVCAVE